ncbi:MAG: acetylxylan esterase [Bryobacterales bacterium]|nr:acetylxylan esterase [Bryobacterales bacterium]
MKLICLFVALTASAQVPATDGRWDTTQGTRYSFPMPHARTKPEWEQRRAHLKRQVQAAAGLLPMPQRGLVKATIFGKLERAGYTIEKVYLETLPGYYLGGNLYRPRGREGKFPAVLTPHGHWKNGRLEHTELASIPGRSINLARQGYVVFAYDMVGYNDTKQTPHAFGTDREHLWNFHPFALQTWNSLRVADFLASLADVDPSRLAMTGASGGGTQTFILAAIDERIGVDVPVNMISASMQGGSPCENAPGLRHDVTNVEIGALMAPRPMLLVAATGDWTKNVPLLEFPVIRQIYSLYDATSRVEAVQFDSPHNYHQRSREAMYTFFSKHVLHRDTGPVAEQPFTVEKPEDMLVFSGRELPAGAATYEGVFQAWKNATAVPQPSREALRHALSVEWPGQVESHRVGDRVRLSRSGKGDLVRGIYRDGTGAPALIVHAGGAEAARNEEAVTGRPALWIDVWGTGESKGSRDTKTNHFYTFHRTDAQNRVQDILTALAWLRTQHRQTVELIGLGEAALWTLFAAAADEEALRLRADWSAFDGSEQAFEKRFFVPGILRAGGLRAAIALTEGKR